MGATTQHYDRPHGRPSLRQVAVTGKSGGGTAPAPAPAPDPDPDPDPGPASSSATATATATTSTAASPSWSVPRWYTSSLLRQQDGQSVQAGGAALQPRQPHTALTRAHHTTSLLLHQGFFVLMALAQVAVTCSQWHKTASDAGRAQTTALSVVLTAVAAWVVRWPWVSYHHRAWFIPVIKVAVFSMPSFREVGVGTALMLERQPVQGALGFLADMARLVTGTRLLSMAVPAIILSQQPAITLLSQAALFPLVVNNASYCNTELLSHPVTQRRLLLLASCLDYSALPLLTLVPLAGLAMGPEMLRESVQLDRVCQSTVSFMQLSVGVLLPTLVSVLCWQLPSEPEQQQLEEAAQQAPEDSGPQSIPAAVLEASAAASNSGRPGPGSAAGAARAGAARAGAAGGVAPAAAAAAAAAEDAQPTPARQPHAAHAAWLLCCQQGQLAVGACDRALHSMARRRRGGNRAALLCWLLLGTCWSCCKVHAGL